MNKQQYLFRLDDACPTMHMNNWKKLEQIFDKHGILPLVGIIPDNQDQGQLYSQENKDFWNIARTWQSKGWSIALHGYKHLYHLAQESGLNPLWKRSEFVGLTLKEQRSKIREGYHILLKHGLNPQYFFAPSHTFDKYTLEALRLETKIRLICDTIANRPYKKYGFTFVPQLGGMPRMILPPIHGIWTFCLHPSIMKNEEFDKVDDFIQKHQKSVISFNDLKLDNIKRINITSWILRQAYFSLRRLHRKQLYAIDLSAVEK